MSRARIASICAVLALTFTPGGAGAQTAPNVTGNWSVSPSGEALANGTVRLRQDGSALTGAYGQTGRIEGKFEPGTLQVDATWSDARGSGWMTIVFAADGRRFSGEWGRPGSRPSGHFDAVRAAYPSVSGFYNVNVTGSGEFTARRINLHQLSLDVVGNYGPGTQLSGTMATDANDFTGTWKSSGSNGWIKLQFADDSKSFQGTWGLVPGTEPAGQITGSVVNTAELGVRGLWQIASSGAAFGGAVLKLDQNGQTVTGSFKNGRLQGMLPRGSRSLYGTWTDPRGTGVVELKFSSDGMSFRGTWTRKNKNGGSIIGRRVIAATPALRQ
jgi:hypothetical protein